MKRKRYTLSRSRPSVRSKEYDQAVDLCIDYPAETSWGVCLSHDVDHLGLREHFIDTFLLRYIINVARHDLICRFRPLRAANSYWGLLLAAMGHDRWNTIEELLLLERESGVRSTWFVPVRKGLGIAYQPEAAMKLVKQLIEADQDLGLHGQSSDEPFGLVDQADELSSWTGRRITGLRMHYLRLTDSLFQGMRAAGFRYDSTVMDRSGVAPEDHPLDGPRFVLGQIIEIPLHIMDSTLFSASGLAMTLAEAKEYTGRLLDRARELEKSLVINTHPNLYSAQSPDIQEWYRWLLKEVTSRSDAFITDFRGLIPRIQLGQLGRCRKNLRAPI